MPLFSDPKSLGRRPKEMNKRLGQVLTPNEIAENIASLLMKDRPDEGVSILDPCVGPGTFPLALLKKGQIKKSDHFFLFDIDELMINSANYRLKNELLKYSIINGDYLHSFSSEKYDFAILNPPYIRQEWIDNKDQIRELFKEKYSVNIPGTSNIYVYFLVKVINELKEGGAFACIIYDSWQFTRYGKWLLSYINLIFQDIQISSAGLQPFAGKLIDASIIVARGKKGKCDSSTLNIVDNATIKNRSLYAGFKGFESVESLFFTCRGLRLKQTSIFLRHLDSVKKIGATPFVKKSLKIEGYIVPTDHDEAALLISSQDENPLIFNELLEDIERAKKDPENNVTILTWLNERPETWFIHKKRPFAPILFNYYLRGRPRHLYNPSRIFADNFYGLLPRTEVDSFVILAILNSTFVTNEIISHARNQGNGLLKIQLFEYRNVLIPDWQNFSQKEITKLKNLGEKLSKSSVKTACNIIEEIDKVILTALKENTKK